MDDEPIAAEKIITPELYFLIAKFLKASPLQETAKLLVQELEQQKLLPKRLDWQGKEHELSFYELENKFSHIEENHLLQLCCRIGPLLDKKLPPSVSGLVSLLGSGRQSVLRTEASVFCARSQWDYCTQLHGLSLPDSALTRPVHNIQKVLVGREHGVCMRRKLLVPTSLYSRTKLLRRTVGHLSSVYCVLFDRTGRYIITGADDLLIKIWSSLDGRLLATLRGASAEITDMAINLDNTMLAAGSIDRILRVWDLQTTAPIAVLSSHTGMITSVNFCPSPRSDLKYLVTTSTDGSIAFWQYSTPRGQKSVFAPKPIQYHEKLRPGQAQMMCTAYSPGGMFLAAVSADHHVRVYLMADDGPKRILEVEAYTDAVDSVQWSHRGLRFITGSKDGTAHIWTFESQQWKSQKLSMTERLPSCPPLEEGKKLKVTMVAWDCSDKYVITAASDHTIKVWDSKTAKLHCVLRGHEDELFVLESNPKDEHVLLSAGHDGQVFLWDIEEGVAVAKFINDIDGQGHGGVFDAKWSPDGTIFSATDSHGHILIFGVGIGPDKYKVLPTELFFHTDYRPLLRDGSHQVVDEQTQVMPHLMPPPFLVDADGNPHPAQYQRYVPGRENCSNDQLIPNLAVDADGLVVEDNGNHSFNAGVGGAANYAQIDRLIAALANRQGGGAAGSNNAPQIDRMIEALANRQGQDVAPDSNNRALANRNAGNVLGNGSGAATSRNGNEAFERRLSVVSNTSSRQGTMWGRPPEQQQQQQQQAPTTPMKYVRRVYVRQMDNVQLNTLRHAVHAAGLYEMQEYRREMRRRPVMISTSHTATTAQTTTSRSNRLHNRTNGASTRSNGAANRSNGAANRGRVGRRRGQRVRAQQSPNQQQSPQQQQAPAYRTRAVRDQALIEAEAEEEDEDSSSSDDTTYSNVEENLSFSDDSDTESSDYSDWVADTPGPNLEPPKRAKRKRRRTLSDDSSDETTEQQATTSAMAQKKKVRNKRVVIPTAPNDELPELYRPSEWLSEFIPRKAPYYPQMGDEVVYFRQGHERYLEAVRLKQVYKLSHNSEPWNSRQLRDHEFVRVIGIKYEIRPPRLCCLKLALMDASGNMTGSSFKIKYHDMPDVLDFLVLRQTFDLAVQRNWSIDDRFRCMIGDGWWTGKIMSRHALSNEFPNSYFMCFQVRWDNGEFEYMSPWDMEPIDESRLPEEVGGAVPVLPEEIRATLYQPKFEEWHRGDRDGTCRRIINGLEQVMSLSIAEHFLAPVDLNIYRDYAYIIEYPIDLTTIKARFENHFYRRITSAQFDVRYLATNAEKYNRSHTNIVKHARIITDLCLRIIREPNDIDVAAVYHQLVDVYHSSESENESDVVPSTSTGPTTSAAARKQLASARNNRRSERIRSEGDWRNDCRQLLEMMCQRPDSAPFREPVDTIEFPDYLEIISTPMDLRTVKEDLHGGNYEDPLDFAKDVRLIFQNSRNYNTNKRSRIYAMTLRLSALFETHIKTVISNWKAARRRANKSSPNKRSPNERPRAAAKKRNLKPTRRSQQLVNDDDDDDDDDDEIDVVNDAVPRGAQRRLLNDGRRNALIRSSIPASTSSSNRVSSSSSAVQRRNRLVAVPQTLGSRSSRRQLAANRETHAETSEADSSADEQPVEDEEEEEDSSEEDSTESSEEDSTEDDNNAQQRRPRVQRRRKPVNASDDDSEESYKPVQRKRTDATKTRRRKSGGKSAGPTKHARKRKARNGNDEHHPPLKRAVGNSRQQRVVTAATRSPRKNNNKRLQVLADDERTAANALHVDESTQDTVSNMPTSRRGRQAVKVQSSSQDMDGPSTSSNAAYQRSPLRSRRNGVVNSVGTRRHPAENDHSYHLPMRNGRIAVESDTDSRELTAARPTRSSVKRAIVDWARGSVDEDVEESEEAEEILPTPTVVKSNSSSSSNSQAQQLRQPLQQPVRDLNGPSTSRAALAAAAAATAVSQQNGPFVRQLRTNRNTIVETPDSDDDDDDDDDESSDNEPLVNSQGSQRHHNVPHPLHLQRSANQHMTRSHATSTTSNVATSSTTATTAQTTDRNYLATTGASTSSAALRNARRVVSRHQCNADELDASTAGHLFASNARLRRGMATSTTTTATASTSMAAASNNESATTLRRGRSRYSQESSNSQPEPTAEEEQEEIEGEENDEEGASDECTDGGSSTLHTEVEEAASDSEDDQPLTSYVSTVRRNTRNHERQRENNRRHNATANYNDDDNDDDEDDDDENNDDDDDDDDDYEQHERRQRTNKSKKSAQKKTKRNAATSARQQRSVRNRKRAHNYNEQSDEDAQASTLYDNRSKRRHIDAEVIGSSGSQAATSSQKIMSGSSDDDVEEYDDEQLISVSSRGRVRKIIPKARGIFKD